MVAFVIGSVARSENELWVRSIGSMTARRLEGTESAALPFWSPDSRRIGFFSNSKLKIVPASGGRAETVSDAPSGRGAVWTRSNVILFAPDAGGPLFRMPASGGTAVPVTKLDSARHEYGHRFPTLLPDGDRFLYAALPGKNGKSRSSPDPCPTTPFGQRSPRSRLRQSSLSLDGSSMRVRMCSSRCRSTRARSRSPAIP
jgi:hypothetical protein